jgi:hypothetical protein
MGYSSQIFIDSIRFKHAFIKFPLMKIKIWIFFEKNDCHENKVKKIIALIVVNVELQSAFERNIDKVIISLEFNGENWVKLSI